MGDRLTDEELVWRLQQVEQHGSGAAAARALNLHRASFNESIKEAKERGLMATTRLQRTEDKLRQKVRNLEAELNAVKKETLAAEEIRAKIYGLAETSPEPPEWLIEKPKKGLPGVPMTIWSDFHWGERVFKEQMEGTNEFNRLIAKKRFKRLVQTTLHLCQDHMVNAKYPGIVIELLGDMITGTIHEELKDTNDGSLQETLLELQEVLIWGLTIMAKRFGRVFVPCVPGNHGRMSLKPRAKNRVFESYEWNLYCQLERHFRNDQRIQFYIPSSGDAHFSVLGHRFLATHGDALGVKGGDGIIGAIGPITRGTIKIGRSEAQIGRDFDTLTIGHWHTYIPRGDATNVIVNGSLKGYDEYARVMLRAAYARPSQALWFIHEQHGFTAQWPVYLDDRPSNKGAPWVTWQRKEHKPFSV